MIIVFRQMILSNHVLILSSSRLKVKVLPSHLRSTEGEGEEVCLLVFVCTL